MTEQAIILTMAHCLAKREVKEEWKRQLIKWVHVDAWELSRAADAYLTEHRAELIEETGEIVRNDPQLRTLVERHEQKRKGNR
jgi:DUF1680 family protein